MRGPEGKTIIFPSTITEALDSVFRYSSLRSAILNEGLTRVERHKRWNDDLPGGQICYSQLKQITLPSTLKVLGDRTFYCYSHLEKVTFRRQTPVAGDSEKLQETFCGEVVLPATLEEVGYCSFNCCSKIKAIWVDNSSIR